ETMRRQDEKTRARYQDFCRRLYAEEIRYTDRWVGELLDALRETVDFDNSLVVISSDHGEELFDHGQFEHGHSLYEEVLRVPLLVKWPLGWEHEKSVTQTVGLISLGRTFIDAAGVPPEMDSVPGLPRRDGGLDTEIFSEGMFWGSERTALTTGDYKIIYHPYAHESRPRFEVYDRRHDRAEQHNIAESEDAAALRERLVRLTRDSETAAKQWQPSREQEFRGIDLSNATREKLKALGYIGN
ncbi:MAG: sulfatase-like hydrolase/transferase, partial [Armatimonadota bacterium]|nr:sulfatase-like hydrolase/transferase [Armatimonadota bacterium]